MKEKFIRKNSTLFKKIEFKSIQKFIGRSLMVNFFNENNTNRACLLFQFDHRLVALISRIITNHRLSHINSRDSQCASIKKRYKLKSH
jgi:hypothetical protein